MNETLSVVYSLEWYDSWYDSWEHDEDFDSKEALDTHYTRLKKLNYKMEKYRKVIITTKREIYE